MKIKTFQITIRLTLEDGQVLKHTETHDPAGDFLKTVEELGSKHGDSIAMLENTVQGFLTNNVPDHVLKKALKKESDNGTL